MGSIIIIALVRSCQYFEKARAWLDKIRLSQYFMDRGFYRLGLTSRILIIETTCGPDDTVEVVRIVAGDALLVVVAAHLLEPPGAHAPGSKELQF